MTTLTRTANKVTLDESSGLQNLAATPGALEDANDNDIALASLNGIFAARLSALSAPATAIGAALSGYTGATGNTGADAFTIGGGGTVSDVKFTDSLGAALNGIDSGLKTVAAGGAGDAILLYTDSVNNNVLLGKVGSTIVFAAYIEETATGGKIWTVQYQALFNPVTTNPDDPVNLLDKVYVTATQTQDAAFDLAGAPSGQNLFLMFSTMGATAGSDGRISGVSIVATGKDPANQSTGANITTGDTLNTSQAGGPTTFGTNSQMITEQEGIRFTFVTGARQNVTIPNLDQNEADVEANIDYTGLFGARTAQFDVVQLQSGKSAQVKVTAISNGSLDAGNNFIDGYANDLKTLTQPGEQVSISNVRVVLTGTETNATGVVITLNIDGSAFITGVKAGQTIIYTTSVDHNRVLIENGAALNASGQTHADFDIGGFTLKQLQSSTATAEIGSMMVFEDDGPTTGLSGAAGPSALSVDESNLPAGATTTFTFSGFFAASGSSGGADGGGSTVTSSYLITVNNPPGTDTLLVDTATGNKIYLYQLNSSSIVGRVGLDSNGGANPSGDIVFTVAIDTTTGTGTLTQSRAIVHDDPHNPNDSKTLGADLFSVSRTDTITDREGDTFIMPTPTVVSVGAILTFFDDGPSITVVKTGTPDALTVDETVLATNATADFSDNYTSTPTYGADGAGPAVTSAYTLGVSGSGAVSGLVDTASNLNVLLYLEGVQVVGRAGSAGGAIVFTVSVSAAGIVTLDQVLAVKHSNTTNPDDSVTLAAASLVTLTRTDTVTDKDGDTNTGADTIGIGQALNFKDDGPSLSFGNLIGSGTVNPQFGNWTKAGGADAVANLDLALNSFTLVRPNGGGTVAGTGTLNEAAVSPDGSGNYHFTGQLTGDFDNNNTTPNTSVDFALDVLANGSYKLDLVQGFGSTQTVSTANGTLGAGGPDPVQTLTVGSESIVFFAANALAPTGTGTPPPNPVESNSLLAGIGLGAPDPTESQLQTNPLPSYIGNQNMNVSTAGIGVANNVLQGDTLEAIGSTDESFVVNPSSLMTQAKVFIDNSVAGYNIATETLYYRVFYDDGSSSALVDVNTVTSEAGGQVSFVVNTVAGKLIDAVQFIMARGDIKIPVIEFTKTTTALASDVKLDFTATLTDGDGDQATSTFAANLMANQLSPTFDYILAGVNAKSDAFNIDLASTDDAWRIDNFQAGDKVVLLGSATNVAIDNSGANSIVTITETGGQTTVVTVVGVDLLPADVGFGGP